MESRALVRRHVRANSSCHETPVPGRISIEKNECEILACIDDMLSCLSGAFTPVIAPRPHNGPVLQFYRQGK